MSILITDDNIYERDPEQFFANLGLLTTGVDVSIAPVQATVTINDDDGNNTKLIHQYLESVSIGLPNSPSPSV